MAQAMACSPLPKACCRWFCFSPGLWATAGLADGARHSQALAPWLFVGLSVAHWGAGALWLSVVLGSVSCIALWRLGQRSFAQIPCIESVPP